MSNPDGRPPKHLPGDRFSRLILLERTKGSKWLCRCDCGEEVSAWACNVISGKTQSCGCLHADIMRNLYTTHGDCVGRKKTPEFQCWMEMKKRCANPKTQSYPRYGGRGISVCARWLESFENFLADMGRKPSATHSIDRINNDGNYEPGNCQWATRREQRLNQSRMMVA